MEWSHLLLILHAAATTMMAGVIWIVQRVHYPLMNYVEARTFHEFERDHQRRIGSVVMPLMLVEAITALLLVIFEATRSWPAILGGVMLAAIWLSTFLVQVPLHRRLERGRCDATIAQLVRTNWIRTTLWTGRAMLAGWMLATWSPLLPG